MTKLIERERLPFDGCDHNGYIFQLKGPHYKDAYISFFASDDFNLVNEVYLKFPHCSGCTKRIIKSNGSITKHQHTFKYTNTGFIRNSLFDMELQQIELYEAVTKNKFINVLDDNRIKDDFIKISMLAKFNKFIERASAPFINKKPQLKLIKGGIK
jgi:hypothetical protein